MAIVVNRINIIRLATNPEVPGSIPGRHIKQRRFWAPQVDSPVVPRR